MKRLVLAFLAVALAAAAPQGHLPQALTPAGIGAVPTAQYAADQANIKALINNIQGVTISNGGVFSGSSPNGKAWSIPLSLVPSSSSILLTAPGAVAATLNGSTFSWANQPVGASVFGGDSGGTSTELGIAASAHGTPANQAAIVANMPSGDFCAFAQMYVTDPDQYYNGGLFLRNPSTGKNVTFFVEDTTAYGTYIGVQTETDFGSGNAAVLAANPPGYDNSFPIHQTFFEGVCRDADNLTFYKSPSGAPGTIVQESQTSIANAGTPTQIGFFEDAFASNGQTYPGVSHELSFRVFPGATPPSSLPGGDLTETFLTQPNYPTSDTLPVIAGIQPSDGVTLPANTPNAFGAIFGTQTTGANFTTVGQVLNGFYTNYPVGNVNASIGSPNDTGQGDNSEFAAVARTYPLNDPNAVHKMLPDGLVLSNNCSRNHTYCYPGQVFGGMIDTPGGNPFLSNSLLEVRAKVFGGWHHWTPIWLYSDQRLLFGPVDPSGYGRFTFVRQCTDSPPPNGTGGCYEIDMNDYFARLIDGGTAVGQEVIFWTPNYGYQYTNPAHWTYMANTASFSAIYKNEQYEQLNAFNCTSNFCDFFLNWRGDGSNLLDLLIAPVTSPPTPAKLISQVYMEFNPLNNGPGGAPLGLHLIVAAAQAIPGAALNGNVLPDYASIAENDGLPNGWSIEVQHILAWSNASIPSPDSYKPTN